LCLAAVGCQSDFDFLQPERSPSDGSNKQVAERYTEEPQDRVRRPWQMDSDPSRRPWQVADKATPAPVQGPMLDFPQDERPKKPWLIEDKASSQGPILQTAWKGDPPSQLPAMASKGSSPNQPAMLPPPTPLAQMKTTTPMPAQPAMEPMTQLVAKGPASGASCANGEAAPPPFGEPAAVQTRPLPTELAMESHPPYVIEPPDVLWIDTIQMVPRSPYTVQALDVLMLRASGTLPNQPIDGAYTITPDGRLNLGFSYGGCRVAGMSLEQAEESVRAHLGKVLNKPQVAISLGQFRGVQQVRGEHLVKADGTISLGNYGSVYVTGLTLQQAKTAIEHHLARFVQDPEVSVDIFAFNSKAYYVICDGGGYGQIVLRFPITGKETVLDAIGQIQGLPSVASTRRIWVARPAPADHCCYQILPVDWRAIIEGGATATNYQLFPGDRVYVKADCLIAIDNWLAKALSPIERLFGITLLGTATVQTIENRHTTTTGGIFIP
jgi:polysaccharide export outer membrane protein